MRGRKLLIIKRCCHCKREDGELKIFSRNKIKNGTIRYCYICPECLKEKSETIRLSKGEDYSTQKGKLYRWRLKNDPRYREMAERRKLYNINRRHSLKVKVRSILNNAIKYGKLFRLPCSICGNIKAQAHHEDYSKPLDVIWFCSKHHAKRESEIRKVKLSTTTK